MADGSLRHLLGHLRITEERVRKLVAARRLHDADPDDPVRGLYVSEEQVDRLLDPLVPAVAPSMAEARAALEAEADRAEADGHLLRLRDLARAFGLDTVDLDILAVAMAPDLDHRFERLYGYLHDDITRRLASTGLAIELLGLAGVDAHARARLGADGPLVRETLVEVHDDGRPWLTRTLRVPDRVTHHLLGDDALPASLTRAIVDVPVLDLPAAAAVARGLREVDGLVYVREEGRTLGLATAVAGVVRAGGRPLVVDPARLDHGGLVDAVREAGLRGDVLVVGPIDPLVEADRDALRPLAQTSVPSVAVGRVGWDPRWTSRPAAVVAASAATLETRRAMWNGHPDGSRDRSPLDVAEATVQFRLRPEDARQVIGAAEVQAAAEGRPLDEEHLRAGVRQLNAGQLDRLSRRLEPRASFDDLVLPDHQLGLLREIVDRARQRVRVLDEWGMGGRSSSGRGVTALFAGPSGTGKTLSAEVVAGALGLDLYVIDLSTVVDKYIGETEKNLERLFDQAEDVNAILFFDEADAIFGKRSEVSDAKDRYANLEIAFLLQRMERFDGITVLATNLRANLDEAFTRRIDVLVDFPTPDEDMRERLWALHLPPTLEREGALPLGELATAFEMAGGDIRNVTLAAAYAAAAAGRAMEADDLLRAVAREYRKLGRLVSRSEFGDWFDTAAPLVAARATSTSPHQQETP